MTQNKTECFAADIAGLSAEALASASLWQLMLASIVGAFVVHVVFLPLARLTMRLFLPMCFAFTIVAFFFSLVYLQQHTRLPLDRYDWVTEFDFHVSEFMSAMFMWKR